MTTRKNADTSGSRVTRARRRAAFIATIRNASAVQPAAKPCSAARQETSSETRSAPLPTRAEPLPPTRSLFMPTAKPEPLPATRTALMRPVQPSPEPISRGGEADRKRAPVEPPTDSPRPKASTQIVEASHTKGVARPVPSAAPATPAAAGQPQPGLFRAEALQHRLSSEEGRGVVRVSPPWTWALLWVVVCGVGAALVSSFIGRIEITSRARGILRPVAGVRVLTSQITGTVVGVDARSGDSVKSGATLLRIESATAEAQLLEAERELEAVRGRFSVLAAQEDQKYAEQVESLHSRSRRLADQIESLRSSVSLQERHVAADRELLKKGLVSEISVGDTQESLAQAERQLSGAETTLDQTRQELASLEARRQDELWQRQQTMNSAQNKRDSLALVMKQNVIVAPVDGTVEALLVKVGEVVQAGQAVGKIVPAESKLHVVSFLPEKDRAFAKVGDVVHLELDQLPHAEYGTLEARVTRISDDLASPSEVNEAIGEGQKLAEPAYRVELEITDAHAADAAGVKLRTGTLLEARFTLRRQKLITLVLSPLKKWLP